MSLEPLVVASVLPRFQALILRRTGLIFPDDHAKRLTEILQARLQALGCDASSYLDLLETGAVDTMSGEWTALAEAVTVGETFFFRHGDQFQALCERVVPEMLRMPGRGARPLTLLSAGCSSGEEPFTLAMVLEELLGAHLAVPPAITAVDLNAAAIERARCGSYPPWSLRETTPTRRERFFRPNGSSFQVADRIRSQVRFEIRNLICDDAEFWRAGCWDVILCRNLLMYLQPEAARAVVGRLAQALTPGGFLFLGYAETLRGLSEAFEVCNTHGTFYYRLAEPGHRPRPAERPAQRSSPTPPIGSLALCALPPPSSWIGAIGRSAQRVASLADDARSPGRGPANLPPSPATALSEAALLQLVRDERYAEAAAGLADLTCAEQQQSLPTLLAALVHLHLGAVTIAEATCRSRLAIAPADARCWYLLGLCCEEAGDLAGASGHYRYAADHDPGFALPLLRCGLVLRRLGRIAPAQAAFSQALGRIPAEDELHLALFGGGFSRQAITDLLRRLAQEVPHGHGSG